MANNFFDLVRDGFFNPFSGPNKRYNYDLLQLINSKMSLDNLQVVKEDIVDWIVDYVDNCPINMYSDDTNEEEKDARTFAYGQVRYFVKCGWLIEDFEGIKITYQLDENGIKILSPKEFIEMMKKVGVRFKKTPEAIHESFFRFLDRMDKSSKNILI